MSPPLVPETSAYRRGLLNSSSDSDGRPMEPGDPQSELQLLVVENQCITSAIPFILHCQVDRILIWSYVISMQTNTNPIAQLRIAVANPLPTLVGACAGIVPIGVYQLGHHELTSWSPIECPKALLVYAGLLFSALTVLSWSRDVFGSFAKAVGFTALVEGMMVCADSQALTAAALVLLVVVNAVANGCRLAVRDAGDRPTQAERAAGRRRAPRSGKAAGKPALRIVA